MITNSLAASTHTSIFNSFPAIRTASAKNRHFHVPPPTFLFPLETPLRLSRYFYIFVSPGAITLNVVWMEREFDAYKLSRYMLSCVFDNLLTILMMMMMCPSNYNRFWDRARYLWKNRHFIIPLAFDAPVSGVPVGISAPPLAWKNKNGVATRRWRNFEDIFIHFDVIHERDRRTDGQTDRHCMTAKTALASHRAVKIKEKRTKINREAW